MKDQFDTLATSSEGTFSERGSKFLAFAYPVNDEADCQPILQSLRKGHPKARHFCTALRLGTDGSLERSNDDGEPSGTAGKPILGQLIKHDLTQVFVVVVRYFGGTKLGVPGLIEAYRSATAEAILHARIVTRQVLRKAELTMPFERYATLHGYFMQHQVPVLEESFGTAARLSIGLPWTGAADLLTGHLHKYSQLDFPDAEGYAAALGLGLEWDPEAVIV